MTRRTLEDSLTYVLNKSREGPMSLHDIIGILTGKGTDILLLFLSLPLCQPIQIPGMSIPFGIVISLIGLRMAVKHTPFLPKFLMHKKIASKTIDVIVTKSLWLVKKIRPLIHPRLLWICQSRFMRLPNGLIIFIAGFFMALPIPVPLSALPCAWVVFLVALGLLEDDGLFVLIGYCLAIAGLVALGFLGFSLLSKSAR